MSVELKIKTKHLSLEAKVIKFEEAKLKKQIRWFCDKQMPATREIQQLNSITSHRKWNVRNENRATYLARAYIKGVPYHTVEKKCKDWAPVFLYILPRMLSMVKKYHSWKTEMHDLKVWMGLITTHTG